MRNKRLVILKVNTILFNKKQIKAMRKDIKKQLRDGIIAIDKGVDIKCIDYDGKQIEVMVVDKDEKVVAKNKS